MTTLKEFEDALRQHGMQMALAILDKLRERDRAKRSIAPARRITGRKMTPEVAHAILELHATTDMTQQEIAFKLGVNQGRVNEVIKRGKWLTDDPASPEAQARDKALARAKRAAEAKAPRRKRDPAARPGRAAAGGAEARPAAGQGPSGSRSRKGPAESPPAQLLLGDL